MKPSPGAKYDLNVGANVRLLSYTVYLDIDGVKTDISKNISKISVRRSAGDSKLATFTSALASEADVEIYPAITNLGSSPIFRHIEILVGFEKEEVRLFYGSTQKVSMHTDGTILLTCLDDALSLARTFVSTPAMFNVLGTIYAKEILEQAGVSSRIAPPKDLIFALDFDGPSEKANVSTQREVSDTDDNGVNQSVIQPNDWWNFSGKPHAYQEGDRSQKLTLYSFPITPVTDNPNIFGNPSVSETTVKKAANSGGKTYTMMPPGRGGGSVTNPTVLDFPDGWKGSKYWGIFQGSSYNSLSASQKVLWNANGGKSAIWWADTYGVIGDPCVLVSDNGLGFFAPNFANPIAEKPKYSKDTKGKTKNSKGKLVKYTFKKGTAVVGCLICEGTLYFKNNTLYAIWRLVRGANEYHYYRSTTNGTTWTAAKLWLSGKVGSRANLVMTDDANGKARVWWVSTRKSPRVMYTASATLPGASLGSSHACKVASYHNSYTKGTGKKKKTYSFYWDIWRMSPVADPKSGVGFCAWGTLTLRGKSFKAGAHPRFMTSVDGVTWKYSTQDLMLKQSKSWDNKCIDNGCLIKDLDENSGKLFDAYYSGQSTNSTHGLGHTDIYESTVSWEGTHPTALGKGAIVYGPFIANKTIDGFGDAKASAIWPRSSADTDTHYLGIGGWFSREGSGKNSSGVWQDPGMNWGDGKKFIFIEASFGKNVKLVLYRYANEIRGRMSRFTGGVWISEASVAMTMSGTWAAGEEHLVGLQASIKYVGATCGITLTIAVDASRAVGATDSTSKEWTQKAECLRAVTICDSWSGLLHTALGLDSTFPGLTLNNLFVSKAPLPAVPPKPMYSMEPSLNTITACAYRGSDPWSELKAIAESELGAWLWDSNGKLLFYNRQHYTDPANAVAIQTIDSEKELKECTVQYDIADVKNSINVRVKSSSLGKAKDIWNLGIPLVVPANSTIAYETEVAGVLESIDTTMNAYVNAGSSRYRAAYVVGYDDDDVPVSMESGQSASSGGAETDLDVSLVGHGVGAIVVIKNNSSKDIVMRDGSGADYMFIWGRVFNKARFSTVESKTIVVRDEASVATFGANEIEVNLPYLSDADSSGWLAQYLLLRFGRGVKRIEGIKAVGDARRDIGDKVIVKYPGFGLNDEFTIEKITDTIGPMMGYEQDIEVSVADGGNRFILGSSYLDNGNFLSQ